jgi:hypothetical protein
VAVNVAWNSARQIDELKKKNVEYGIRMKVIDFKDVFIFINDSLIQ